MAGRSVSTPYAGVVKFDINSLDAFARLRVSSPTTLFDSKQISDNEPLFWDDQEVSGGSTTSAWSGDTASSVMGVGATTAGKRVRQTFMRFNYQPGKSQLIFMTGTLDVSGGGAGITRGWGLFDDNNGIGLLDEEGTLKFFIRSSYTGSAVDNKVSQTDWNVDKLDGKGKSRLTLDGSKSQILFFDFEWLGVGTVAIGFIIDGVPVYCHCFHHANKRAGVYMSTPNLPLRYEIENDGTGAASTMEHICSTVISEGGTDELGVLRYASTAGTTVTSAVENTIYAVIGIRLKSTHIGDVVRIQRMALQIQSASENIEWLWILNPTVAGTFTFNDQTNSSVQIATGATANTVSGGTSITGGYAESTSGGGGSGGVTSPIPNALLLGSAIDGTVDEMVLCFRPIGGVSAADVEGSITWRELS